MQRIFESQIHDSHKNRFSMLIIASFFLFEKAISNFENDRSMHLVLGSLLS